MSKRHKFPPLHAALSGVLRDFGESRIEAWLNGRQSMLFYYLPKNAAYELAYRYARRFKPPCYYGKELNRRISYKYHNNNDPFPVGLGVYDVSKHQINPTVEVSYCKEAYEARCAADKKIARLIKKYDKQGYPDKDVFIAEILLIETKELLNAKTWLYGKKGVRPSNATGLN